MATAHNKVSQKDSVSSHDFCGAKKYVPTYYAFAGGVEPIEKGIYIYPDEASEKDQGLVGR